MRNHLGEVVDLVVVPKSFRDTLLQLVHEHTGHVGAKKARLVMCRHFWWPGVSSDVGNHCGSCPQCQAFSRGGVRKAPMVPRPVVTLPFECMAMDLVGPLPQG